MIAFEQDSRGADFPGSGEAYSATGRIIAATLVDSLQRRTQKGTSWQGK